MVYGSSEIVGKIKLKRFFEKKNNVALTAVQYKYGPFLRAKWLIFYKYGEKMRFPGALSGL